jgi:hypothetical protein
METASSGLQRGGITIVQTTGQQTRSAEVTV